MKIAIHAVDSHNYPNLALMKISAWHKSRGDDVEWFSPLCRYDIVYASKIFTFTPDDPYLPPNAIRGGTGYDITSKLPAEIERTKPDYTIYPQFREAYGFLTRGCVNNCPWCVVPRKEGYICIAGDIEDICTTNTGFRKQAILMDNNFLAAPIEFCSMQIDKMRRLGVRVDFNQATDARLYNSHTAPIMAKCPVIRYLRLSCDTDNMLKPCTQAISLLRECGYQKEVFVYILAKNDGISSALWRINELCALDSKVVPFVMPYRSLDDNSVVPSLDLRRLARWCNRAWLRKSTAFADYHG